MRLKTRYLLILQAVVLVVVVFGAARGTMTAGAPQQTATAATSTPSVASAPVPAASSVPRPAVTAATERQLLDKYCLACHNEKARAAGVDSARKLAVDTLDVNQVTRDARTWENVARRLRAGMMPPAGMPRPDPVT